VAWHLLWLSFREWRGKRQRRLSVCAPEPTTSHNCQEQGAGADAVNRRVHLVPQGGGGHEAAGAALTMQPAREDDMDKAHLVARACPGPPLLHASPHKCAPRGCVKRYGSPAFSLTPPSFHTTQPKNQNKRKHTMPWPSRLALLRMPMRSGSTAHTRRACTQRGPAPDVQPAAEAYCRHASSTPSTSRSRHSGSR